MPDGFYKAIIKAIKSEGYEYLRNAKGSHEWWIKPATGEKVLVPRSTKSRHTANAILRDAGSTKRL